MKKGYDFSRAKPNPYAGRLKKQITIQVDLETIGYFRKLADEIGIPYQTLISLYLRDCAASHKKPKMHWRCGDSPRHRQRGRGKKMDSGTVFVN